MAIGAIWGEIWDESIWDTSIWAGGSSGTYAYPLQVGALAIQVVQDGEQSDWRPLAPEARRGTNGNLLSAITSARGHRAVRRYRTIPMSRTAAETLTDALTTGLPLAFTGWLVDGAVTAFARRVRVASEPNSNRVSVSFEIHE